MNVALLSAIAVSALVSMPAPAATIVVNNQSQFDAAIAAATQPGHADTIDATAAGTIDAGTSLTLPGAATSINLTFGRPWPRALSKPSMRSQARYMRARRRS